MYEILRKKRIFGYICRKNNAMADSPRIPADAFARTALLLGPKAMQRIGRARVILFGIGGVGSWCAEALIRAGIRDLTIVDPDDVAPTNLNRQLMATTATLGHPKVEALRERLLDINPEAAITARREAYNAETAAGFDLSSYDFVIDAIDALKDKALLILDASASRATFFSSMGSALKTDPTKVRVAEFWSVRGCPLGSALRKKLRREKTLPAKPFLCVYDDEVLENRGAPVDPAAEPGYAKKAVTNGTLSYITGIFGLTLAGLVIQSLAEA